MAVSPLRLQPGEIVRAREERWRVVGVDAFGSCAIVELAGVDVDNAERSGRFIVPFETIDRLPQHRDRPEVVSRAAWRRAAGAALAGAAPGWRSLRAAASADVSLLPFQLEPALAMTRGLACRFLLADEVGLGKTIQAGLLMAEVRARERHARMLVVTPAGLRAQWRDELHDRFGIDATVIDAAELARAAADLPLTVNPWTVPHVVITSIDFLKRPDVIRALEPLVWDLVVFDEAHGCCGRSDRARAAELVAARGRRVVLITATPHSGDAGDYERLRGIGRIGDDDRLIVFRRSRRAAGVPGERAERRLSVTLTLDELRVHRALKRYADLVSREAPARMAPAARLAMIVLARRASSSAASLARSLERRIELLTGRPGTSDTQLRLPLFDGQILEDEEPLEELSAPGLVDAAVEQRWLHRVLALARRVSTDSKLRVLCTLLRRSGETALVFTEYRDTLQRLRAVLDKDAAILHGGLTAAERQREARRFTHGGAGLLLATDAASEGLNLHQRCRLVVNMDVPWTPRRLEQRVGRVDRLGQGRRVHALTLVARGTADELTARGLASRSARAGREAPFQPFESCDLRDEASSEAARLVGVRMLSNAPHAPRSTRPALTALRRRARPGVAAIGCRGLLLAVRLVFVDTTGAIAWNTIGGFIVGADHIPDRRAVTLRRWFVDLVSHDAMAIAHAASTVHQQQCSLLQRQVRDAVAPLVGRERAILDHLTRQHGRLAAPLLQQGLFDRRSTREADAQRRLIQEAATGAHARIDSLQRLCEVSPGDCTLLFAAVWTR